MIDVTGIKAYTLPMSRIGSLSVLEEWLNSYLNFEKLPQKNMFWLDTMQFLCARFGNPQNCIPAFHIAGSKGKGSVSSMISSILEEAGHTVGLYTSPHITDFVERVGTAHGCFTDFIYDKAVSELIDGIKKIPQSEFPGGRPLTWFELATLFAFICFRQAEVDWGVYEVGLGGRLDATNVLMPEICAITPIELEHTQYLGNTVEKIAAEKAGIIKESVPVIIAAQQPSVRKVFASIAAERHAPVFFVDELLKRSSFSYVPAETYIKKDTSSFDLDNCAFYMNIHLESAVFARPVETKLLMPGAFQVGNAALAALTVKKILPEISETVIEKGLSRAMLPGRFELIHPEKDGIARCIVLDGAHTVNSVHYTMDTFNNFFNNFNAHLLFACAADKDAEDIAVLFRGRFSRITVTVPGNIKQSDPERMENAFKKAGIPYILNRDYKAAIEEALQQADREPAILLVTGSFYLLAEVKKILSAYR
jgi:dihydrofolate synthase / folylpolyglutamate synthase